MGGGRAVGAVRGRGGCQLLYVNRAGLLCFRRCAACAAALTLARTLSRFTDILLACRSLGLVRPWCEQRTIASGPAGGIAWRRRRFGYGPVWEEFGYIGISW